MAPAGELEGEKAGAAPGVERVELAAGRKNEIEDAIPRGALGLRADAVAEVFVESGRPPVPVCGDLLLDDVRWAGLAGGAHGFTPSRSLRSALHPAPPGSRRAGRCWAEALPGCGRPWPGTGPGYPNSRRCRLRPGEDLLDRVADLVDLLQCWQEIDGSRRLPVVELLAVEVHFEPAAVGRGEGDRRFPIVDRGKLGRHTDGHRQVPSNDAVD